MLFKKVIGQEALKSQLISEIKAGRVSHAQLFSGPKGVGKLPLALAYARYLLCSNPGEEDACGVCHSCKMLNNLAHPDLHFVFPTKPKTTCDDLLEEWRECVNRNPYFDFEDWLDAIDAKNAQPTIYVKESDTLLHKLSLKPYEGGYKIAIIWLPEKMQESCANKLLKLIEEPPAHTVMLLVSDEPEKILPTILSRTQQVNISKLPESTIAAALTQSYGTDSEEAARIAHLCEGNLSVALKTVQTQSQGDSHIYFDLFISLMRLSYQRKVKAMKQWSEEMASMGREKQKSFLEYALRMIRESFIYNLHQPTLNYMTSEEEQFVTKFSPFVNEKNIQGIAGELDHALNDIGRNVNGKIVFFDFALKMIMLLKN